MEQDFYTDDFEQLLKEKSDQFRMYPSKRVWHSIYNNLHPGRRWPSFAMSLLLVASLILIGYLNTSDNTMTVRFAADTGNENITEPVNLNQPGSQQPVPALFSSVTIKDVSKNSSVTAIDNNDPAVNDIDKPSVHKYPVTIVLKESFKNNIVQEMDSYISADQIFADIASINKDIKAADQASSAKEVKKVVSDLDPGDFNKVVSEINTLPLIDGSNASAINSSAGFFTKPDNKTEPTTADKESLSTEERSWIENYAMHNKSPRNKWKDRVAVEFYITPAVNYRKLSTNTKGSNTAFANSDINHSISQKPGMGLEAGIGLEYAIAKNLRLKAGAQFNYTNYNINADQTNHPILTSILLTDTYTGFSYPAARSSTISNTYNSSAQQPVILHNRTYQVSIPLGLAYRLSGSNNVEWFAGASFQPTYVFGGNAHLLSSDLKNYVYDPSSIRSWNLNLGFETYMNYKLGNYNLLVGPQVRYQVYSTYRKNIALIEKPYAIGFKLGIVKGL